MPSFTTREISDLEEVAARFWSALEQQSLGRWQLRFADGVTRRANSVLAQGSPDCQIDDAIDYAQDFYSARGFPTYFQMTSASLPRDLDSRLQDRGYVEELRVYVETSDLGFLSHYESEAELVVEEHPTDAWIDTYRTGGGYSEQAMETRLEIISRCTEDKGMATAFFDGEPAGVGLGVTDGDWLGLFSIITLPKLRRRGVAKCVSSGLASWSQSKGATRAFLQVETDNLPARKLYKGMGFQISYEYWYRCFVAE